MEQAVVVKAIVVREVGGPDALVLEQVADPQPRRHEIVVAVEASGVCFHDIVTRNGTLRAGVATPFIPGHEVAGTVVARGADVGEFAIGDRVATTQRSFTCGHCRSCRGAREPLCSEAVFMGDAGLNGGYAEYVATSAATVARIPEAVSTVDAAVTACAIGTVLHAVGPIGRLMPGETALVTGAGGGLGIHAVQVARAAGGMVIAQTTSAAKVAAIRAAGADHVVVGNDDAAIAEIRDLTSGRGVDVAVDTVGTPVFRLARRALASGGRWVLVGQVNGDFVPFNPAQLFLRGVSMLSATSTTRAELQDALELVRLKRIQAMIGATMPLDQAAEAHRLLERQGVLGRVVLQPGLA